MKSKLHETPAVGRIYYGYWMQVLVVLEKQAYLIVAYQYNNSIKTVGLIDFFHLYLILNVKKICRPIFNDCRKVIANFVSRK